MQSEIERVIETEHYRLIKRRDGFAKLEKRAGADRVAQSGKDSIEQSTRASIAKWLRENSDTRTVDQFIDDYIANGHDLEKTKAKRRPTYAEAQAAIMRQFTACEPVTMASWKIENPAIGTLRKELQRDGDPRTPEQFLRDLINAEDKAAATKFREVKAARDKLMRQVSGQVD